MPNDSVQVRSRSLEYFQQSCICFAFSSTYLANDHFRINRCTHLQSLLSHKGGDPALRGASAGGSGGWGPLLGDAGNGHSIGAAALSAVARAADRRGPETPLQGLVLRQLGLSTPEDLLGWAYAGDAPDRRQAAAAPPPPFQAFQAFPGGPIGRTDPATHAQVRVAHRQRSTWDRDGIGGANCFTRLGSFRAFLGGGRPLRTRFLNAAASAATRAPGQRRATAHRSRSARLRRPPRRSRPPRPGRPAGALPPPDDTALKNFDSRQLGVRRRFVPNCLLEYRHFGYCGAITRDGQSWNVSHHIGQQISKFMGHGGHGGRARAHGRGRSRPRCGPRACVRGEGELSACVPVCGVTADCARACLCAG